MKQPITLPPGAEALQVRLAVELSDPAGLLHALSHRSYCAEHAETESNERLEFLGDSVLGLVVTDHLYRAYPAQPEGELAKIRAAVVNTEVLAEVARAIELGDALRLGKGEDASGGREKTSILADTLEAVIAAIYLDAGWSVTERVVMDLVGRYIDIAAARPGDCDYKSLLQELAARRFERLPRYQVRDEGPDHAKHFFAVVLVDGEPRGEGEGRSKKRAEQMAAHAAWATLSVEHPADPAKQPSVTSTINGETNRVGSDDAGTT
ncbi:MAG TPA: ribonuclease III [Acidimicrobiia bacterium]|nr:ribonuclease III [Acidimicrobiia bacterium]